MTISCSVTHPGDAGDVGGVGGVDLGAVARAERVPERLLDLVLGDQRPTECTCERGRDGRFPAAREAGDHDVHGLIMAGRGAK
jgi:hypothetical protein